jgi:pimeloyl-ACP methyl ester carboxylesterase
MASREITYNTHPFFMHYDILYHDNREVILFLHGWGSSKEIMKQAFSKHFKQFKHLYVDMPGFGKTPNEIPLTTQDYAAIITTFLDEMQIKPTIIVGHSFGGKVATLLKPEKLLLLSSAGIPLPKPRKVQIKIKLFKLLKPFGVAKLRKFFASNDVQGMNEAMYETFKNVVDEDFTPYFKATEAKTVLFWGKEDSATPLHAGEKMASLIHDSHFYPLDGDHFFFIKEASFIDQITQKEFYGDS